MTDMLYQFAKKLVDDGMPILHNGLGIIGVPIQVFAPGEYKDPEGNTLDCTVLRLQDGNTFIVNGFQGELIQLTMYETHILEQFTNALSTLVLGASIELRKQFSPNVDHERMRVSIALIRSALAAQLRALGS